MKTNPAVHHGRGVEGFLTQHAADVTGVISGFDRLRLRASLRWLYQPTFMQRYLCEARVLLKDFGGYATALSDRIRAAAHAFAAREHRSVRYLRRPAAGRALPLSSRCRYTARRFAAARRPPAPAAQ